MTDSLRTPPVGLDCALPVQIPDDPSAVAGAERRDRFDPIDGQLAQALQIAALGTELLDQEAGVGDLQLMPAAGRRLHVGARTWA